MDRFVSISSRLLVVMLLAAAPVSAAEILVTPNGSAWDLTLDPPSTIFHTTEGDVINPMVIAGPDSILLLLWNEQVAPDDPVPYYALSFDGVAVSRVHPTSYVLKLTAGTRSGLRSSPVLETEGRIE